MPEYYLDYEFVGKKLREAKAFGTKAEASKVPDVRCLLTSFVAAGSWMFSFVLVLSPVCTQCDSQNISLLISLRDEGLIAPTPAQGLVVASLFCDPPSRALIPAPSHASAHSASPSFPSVQRKVARCSGGLIDCFVSIRSMGADYDDSYCIEYANKHGAYIVSNDKSARGFTELRLPLRLSLAGGIVSRCGCCCLPAVGACFTPDSVRLALLTVRESAGDRWFAIKRLSVCFCVFLCFA